MQIWLEDSTGARLGPGPLTSAVTWQHTRELDRVGTFAFSLPADDPLASEVRVKRVARCWQYEDGQWREYGAGIIERREYVTGANGPMLRVSGQDLLRELTYQRGGSLTFTTEMRVHPNKMTVLDSAPAAEYWCEEWGDGALGDDTTWAQVDARGAFPIGFIYLSCARRFRAAQWVIDATTHNHKVSELQVQYFDTDMDPAGWSDVPITEDGTAVDGKPFSQSGIMRWEMPANWGTETTTDEPRYTLRIGASEGLDAIKVYDVTLLYDVPTESGLQMIMAQAPAGWSLDPTGYASTKPPLLLGDNLLVNPSFEDLTSGTADDGATDVFVGWTNYHTAAAARVEATVLSSHAGSQACMLVCDALGADPILYQTIAVEPNADYRLSLWARNDGTADADLSLRFGFYDGDLAADGSHTVATTTLSDLRRTAITGTAWQQYTTVLTTPPNRDQVTLALWGPPLGQVGYVLVDDLDFRRYLGGETYLRLENENIMEALNRLAEHTGEHFDLAVAGRQVLWLRDDQRHSGIRLVAGVDPVAVETDDDLGLLVSLTEIADAYTLASRVYAFGGGTGEDRVSLKETTRTAPDGYTLNLDEGYLERDAAVAALGRIDYYVSAPEVNAQATDDTQRSFAANTLFDTAYHWLRRHSATNTHPVTGDVPRAYTAVVAKLNRIVLPGYYVTVRYREVVDGFVAADIDADLCVLSAATTIDQEGLRTTALTLGTVDYPLYSDADVIANALRRQAAYLNQTQATQRTISSGMSVVTSLNVRGGRVATVRRRQGATQTASLDLAGGASTITLTFRDGVLVSAT